MIGRNGERRSGISAQAARHDDDDDSFNVKTVQFQSKCSLIVKNISILNYSV